MLLLPPKYNSFKVLSIALETVFTKTISCQKLTKMALRKRLVVKLRLGVLELHSICKSMTSHLNLLTRKFLQKLFSRVTNSTLWNTKFHFKLLTRILNFHLSTLLTRCWKIKSFTSSYWFEVEQYRVSFRVTNKKLKNKKFHFKSVTLWENFHFFAFELLIRGWKIKRFSTWCKKQSILA